MNGKYNTLFYLPIFCLTGTIGLLYIIKFIPNYQIKNNIIIFFVIISLFLSIFMINHWINPSKGEFIAHDYEYASADYIKKISNSNKLSFISNNEEYNKHIEEYTYLNSLGRPLPIQVYFQDNPPILLDPKFKIVTNINTNYFWFIDKNKEHLSNLKLDHYNLIFEKENYREIIYKKSLKYLIIDKNEAYTTTLFNEDFNEVYDNTKITIKAVPYDFISK